MNLQKIGEADWSQGLGRYDPECREMERHSHIGITTNNNGQRCVYIKENPLCDNMDAKDYLMAFDSDGISKIEFYRFVK